MLGSRGGRLGPDFPLLRELEPQLGEQGGVGHALPPQAGQHSLILTVILAQRLNSAHAVLTPVSWIRDILVRIRMRIREATKHTGSVDPDPELWSRIRTCDKRIRMRIRKAQKHTAPTDPDP
jgi:hypothetical protein